MLHVRLHRINPNGQHAHKSRFFEDLSAVARFFATEEGDRWHWADLTGPLDAGRYRSFSSTTLRRMAACEVAHERRREMMAT